MNIDLVLFKDELEQAVSLIQQFWDLHNNDNQSVSEACSHLGEWTSDGHQFYFITKDDEYIGFVHLASRGGEIDWLEDLFVVPAYQNQGIGTYVIGLVEDEVKQYSESLYIEVSTRNRKAIQLYHKIGYDCLNTITVRKDFSSKDKIMRTEKLYDLEFNVKVRDKSDETNNS